jgi:hypothetical protein
VLRCFGEVLIMKTFGDLKKIEGFLGIFLSIGFVLVLIASVYDFRGVF